MRLGLSAQRAVFAVTLSTLLLTVALAGCVQPSSDNSLPGHDDAGSPAPRASTSFLDTDDGQVQTWVVVELTQGQADGYARGQVEAWFKQTNEEEMTQTRHEPFGLCDTPALNSDKTGCQAAFEPGEAWEPGSRLYLRCPEQKMRLLVTVDDLYVAGQASLEHDTNIYGCFKDQADTNGSTSVIEVASRLADIDEDGKAEWLRFTLTKGSDAPYPRSDIQVELTYPDGRTEDFLCDSASFNNGCGDLFEPGDTWDVGQVKWTPCVNSGSHHVRLSFQGTVVFDQDVGCEEPHRTYEDGPESASATARGFAAGGSDVNWIRISLVKGETAPYGESEVSYEVTDPSGTSHEEKGPKSGASDDVLCTSAQAAGGVCDGSDFHQGGQANGWDVGQVLYVPCQEAGEHDLAVSVKGTLILDTTVTCDTAA